MDLKDQYYPTWGACGESECCKPSKCPYVDTYQGDYDELAAENEFMYSLLREIRRDYPGIIYQYEDKGRTEFWEKMDP